ncbi:MAG: hypothetical protein AAGA92_13480 [Planctomycetota bacterium]
MRTLLLAAGLATATTIATTAAQAAPLAGGPVLFRDDMTTAANWSLVRSPTGGRIPTDSAATFDYDYSADGVPEAPNSQPGDAATAGVKLEANHSGAPPINENLLRLYPVGQSFTGGYVFRFDAWLNYDAVERNEGGRVGTTERVGGGVGYAPNTNTVLGAHARATGDGDGFPDWQVWNPDPVPGPEFAAGSRQGDAPYYAMFLPGVPPPAAQNQIGQNPPQLGVAGSPGFQWITWEFRVDLDRTVSIAIEKPDGSRLPLYSFMADDRPLASPTDGPIVLEYFDFSNSVAARPDLTFGLVDNVVVTRIPEPGAASLAALALTGLIRRMGDAHPSPQKRG